MEQRLTQLLMKFLNAACSLKRCDELKADSIPTLTQIVALTVFLFLATWLCGAIGNHLIPLFLNSPKDQ